MVYRFFKNRWMRRKLLVRCFMEGESYKMVALMNDNFRCYYLGKKHHGYYYGYFGLFVNAFEKPIYNWHGDIMK